ncbi:MAG: dihydroorotate dehydrogenase electron transfer subunit [Candidatus Heimdallarchaeum aukensis]|uniref:Dihydroorotate dehydrogenase electron transfer subunit n=1 Tax=Candidatus Heimdallarchaeum aukensis TaxID=2876573 RepID=A0A9Y1FLH4_9ARCH|nr:MAG: dihydroorotate dehydrogenase electron transfer subunit [Candidatus Heimdallarchaeum aukensis]
MTKYFHNSKPEMCKIIKIMEENEDTRTFSIKLPFTPKKPKPGQFVMLWVPGIDEFPIGVAGIKDQILELCVAKVGEGTKALFELEQGDLVGIRGFFGKAFRIKKSITHIIVGGGYGMPPLKYLIEEIIKGRTEQDEIFVFEGARTKEKLLYVELLEKWKKEKKIDFFPFTDDGSYGKKGFPTEGVKEYLNKDNEKSVVIYSAGPEKMMKILFDICKNYNHIIDIQMSLADRHMRCGFGLCGACVVDPEGLRICVDGPVFSREQLEKMDDFGNYSRLPSGKKEEI